MPGQADPGRPDMDPELPLDPDYPDARTGRPVHLRAGPIGAVLLGGALGTLARDGLAVATPTASGHWPWATFTANMVAAFVLGALLELLTRLGSDDGWRQRLRVLLGTGFCGGLSTYSTYAVETDLLVRAHSGGLAAGYLTATLVGGFIATVAGIALATRWHLHRYAANATNDANGTAA